MKNNSIYQELFHTENEQQLFQYMIENLKPSNTLWTYFVDWGKVYQNVKEIEICLNLLNYLIGKENFDEEFKRLVREEPRILRIIPALVVSRNVNFDILIDYKNRILTYENYDFTISNPTENDMERYLHFIKATGLKELITSGKVKSLVDYMIGVEAGLDSNGRKNRGGHAMENIVEAFIQDLCIQKNYSYLSQANASKIYSQFQINIPVDRSSRIYDFVIKTNTNLVIFEVNFYGDGGSKLKSTAGEYRNLYDVLGNRFPFIWITDGQGWKKTQRPLYETFEHNDTILTLSMLEKGILEYLL